MSRNLIFVLLLATAVALGHDRSAAQQATGAAEAQRRTGAAQGRTERAQAQAEKGQRPSAEVHAKTDVVQGSTEHAQPQAEKPVRRTEEAQEKTDAAQGSTEHAQPQAEKPQTPNEEEQGKTEEGAKLIAVPGGKALGMSILGNQEAPKSLVIVPWKSSELGRTPGISPMLDDSRQPVDKEVFMRALRYYEIRSETKP